MRLITAVVLVLLLLLSSASCTVPNSSDPNYTATTYGRIHQGLEQAQAVVAPLEKTLPYGEIITLILGLGATTMAYVAKDKSAVANQRIDSMKARADSTKRGSA